LYFGIYIHILRKENGEVILILEPRSVDGYANKFGKQTIRTGGNGKSYIWLEMRGSYRGKMGTFEYIKDKNGLINHRYFNTSK